MKSICKNTIHRKYFILNDKYSINEKLSKLDQLMNNEQKYQINLKNQYKKYLENLFQLNQQLLLIRKREKKFKINNQAYQNQLINMKKQINQFDQERKFDRERINQLLL